MTLYATTGTKFFVGSPRPAWRAGHVDAGAFAADAWTEVQNLENLGRIGGEWELEDTTAPIQGDPDAPTFQTLEKISRTAPRMVLSAGASEGDAGQLALLAAYDAVDAYGFRLVLPDGAQRLFIALAVRFEDIFEASNKVIGFQAELAIQSNVVRLAP